MFKSSGFVHGNNISGVQWGSYTCWSLFFAVCVFCRDKIGLKLTITFKIDRWDPTCQTTLQSQRKLASQKLWRRLVVLPTFLIRTTILAVPMATLKTGEQILASIAYSGVVFRWHTLFRKQAAQLR